MTTFIGRKNELETFGSFLKKRSASLIVIKGRRRIGKSRLVEEFSRRHPFESFYNFAGISPTEETSAQSQRDVFATQLGEIFGVPGIRADDWTTLLLLLNEKIKDKK